MAKEGLTVNGKARHDSGARGEAGAVQRGGGRFFTLVCGSDVFHNVADRWPEAVDGGYWLAMRERLQMGYLSWHNRADGWARAAPEGSEGQNHLTQSYSRKDRSHVLTSFALEFAARAPLPQLQDRSYRARVHAVSIRGPPCPRTVRSGSRVQTIRSGQRSVPRPVCALRYACLRAGEGGLHHPRRADRLCAGAFSACQQYAAAHRRIFPGRTLAAGAPLQQ